MMMILMLMLKMYLSLFEVAHTDNTDGLLTVLSARLARVSGGCHCDHSADGEDGNGEDNDECCVCRSRQPRHDNLRKEYDNYEAVGWKDLGRKFGHAGPRSSPTKFLPLATPNDDDDDDEEHNNGDCAGHNSAKFSDWPDFVMTHCKLS